MIVSVFGASGRTGQAFIQAAANTDLTLRLHYRSRPSDTLPISATVVVGSLADPAAVREVLRGADVSLLLFGPKDGARVPFCADATKVILAAMHTANQSRLIVQTGALVGAQPDNVSFGLRMMRAFVHRTSPAEAVLEDREEQERLVRNSTLAGWTLVKPSRLTEEHRSARVAADPTLRTGLRSQVSRSALGGFLLGEVLTPRFARQAVYVAEE